MKSYFAMLGNAINVRKVRELGYANKGAFVILGDLITIRLSYVSWVCYDGRFHLLTHFCNTRFKFRKSTKPDL